MLITKVECCYVPFANSATPAWPNYSASRQQTFALSWGHEVDFVSHDDKRGFGIAETPGSIPAGGIQISRDNTTVYKIVLLGSVWPESQLYL